jgi:hypothetical protein
MTTPTTTIQFDASDESQVFVATRTVRNSEHQNGTIEQGARVFFRRDDTGRVSLVSESGEPTNGNQYAEWAYAGLAAEFAARFGLVAEDTATTAAQKIAPLQGGESYLLDLATCESAPEYDTPSDGRPYWRTDARRAPNGVIVARHHTLVVATGHLVTPAPRWAEVDCDETMAALGILPAADA